MENNKNGNIVLTVLGVATLLVAIAGASFAYFTATATTTDQAVSTGVLKVSATAGAVQGANIKPVKSTDIENIEEKKSNPDVVKIPIAVNTTDTTIDATFDMYMTATGLADSGSYTEGVPEDIKWELIGSDDSTLGSGTFGGSTTDLKLNTAPVSITSGTTTYNYTLLVYILDTEAVQDDLQGLTLSATVRVDAKQA